SATAPMPRGRLPGDSASGKQSALRAVEEVDMRVKDLMTTDVLTVRSSTPLKDAAAVLAEHRISGLPVVDGQGRVFGVLSEGDILYKESGTQEHASFLDRWLSVPAIGADLKLAARTVGEAMTAPA